MCRATSTSYSPTAFKGPLGRRTFALAAWIPAATIASEFFIVLYNFLVVRESGKYIDFVIWRKNLIQALLGFFSIIIIGFGVKLFVTNSLLFIFSITLVGIIVYLLELKLLKNPLLDHILDMVKHKFRRG